MCSISLLRYHLAQPHGTAASHVTSPGLVLEGREKSATLRCSNTVMLLTVSVLVFSASGTIAQVQETVPPLLSSGPRDANPAATPLIEHLTPGPATQSVFDAPSLPPIESIGPGSDIRPFLKPGVPQDLTRAALRRAWAADPAIRDFIGLSENSWDFNAPDAVPGFGFAMTEGTGRLPAGTAENSMLNTSDQSGTELSKSGR